MKELFQAADLKGILHHRVYELLHQLGWEAVLKTKNPNCKEWGNKERKRINEEAVKEALIIIDYWV